MSSVCWKLFSRTVTATKSWLSRRYLSRAKPAETQEDERLWKTGFSHSHRYAVFFFQGFGTGKTHVRVPALVGQSMRPDCRVASSRSSQRTTAVVGVAA